MTFAHQLKSCAGPHPRAFEPAGIAGTNSLHVQQPPAHAQAQCVPASPRGKVKAVESPGSHVGSAATALLPIVKALQESAVCLHIQESLRSFN